MKSKITLLLFLMMALTTKAQSNAEILETFLADVISFENVKLNADRPICKIRQLASVQADKIYILTPQNAAEAIETAQKYEYCVIFTGSHTVAKVTDFSNTTESGSWNTIMPYGEGYIQRGEMTKKEDYINNIIGTADNQKRGFFLFNLK